MSYQWPRRFLLPQPLSAAVVLLFALALELAACSTPVFQYALLRWTPDAYQVAVVHRGSLSKEHQLLVEELRTELENEEQTVNALMTDIDLETTELPENRPLAEVLGPLNDLPRIVLRLPHAPRRREEPPPLWTAPLTKPAIEQLLDSPLRRKLSDALLAGNVCWVLLESGNAEADRKAAQRLEEALQSVTKDLQAMAGEEIEPDPTLLARPAIPRFSLVKLEADQHEELLLRRMLMRTEPDLKEYVAQPMAFPVFGRGRSLVALIGEGIHLENVQDVCGFLLGPCACETKALNPGSDLLLRANWYAAVEAFEIGEEPVPDLTGVLPDAEPVEPTDGVSTGRTAAVAPLAETPKGSAPSVIIVSAVVMAAALLVGSLFVFARRPR